MPRGNPTTNEKSTHLSLKISLFIFITFTSSGFLVISIKHTTNQTQSSKKKICPKMASCACASSAIAAVAFSSSPSSQKSGSIVGATKASFLGGRQLRVRKYRAQAGTQRVSAGTRSVTVCAVADPERPLWFPGSTPPPWLDGSLPGDFGFDPLGLGSDPETLRWNVQSEIVHCRWAMLGAAGIFIPEFLTKIGILNTPSWYTAGELEYFTDKTTLFVVELIFIGWAEGRRWADIISPGSVNTDPIFPNNKLTGTDVGYPGGLWFDPLGWGSGSPEKIKELRTKEIKNGRLAMLAVIGAWFQAIYTGTGPIDNLFAHLADPGHATIFAAFSPK
ncbi:Chlorophyll a-b binding protein 7, chloroplastic [Sarracenia purpurea var. burkii]